MNDPVYDEVAAFLAELVAGGVRHVVLSPGSRSTPLALCAAAQPALTHWMQLDERTAGFFALGLAKATRSPVVLACTSGTAAANYFPAIIEASRTGVALIVLSSDRPPEMHGEWGANQTIDQSELFGSYSRLFVDLPLAGTTSVEAVRDLAQEVLVAVGSPRIGPAHVNWPFRKPLEPLDTVPFSAPPDSHDPSAIRIADDLPAVDQLRGIASVERGAIVVGPLDDPAWVAALARFAAMTGWPILAEATSQLRLGQASQNVIGHADRILSNEALRSSLAPEVVVFAGATPTGPVFLQWMREHQTKGLLLVDPSSPWTATGSQPVEVITLAVESVESACDESNGSDEKWLGRWRDLDRIASSVIERVVGQTLLGPGTVRRTVAGLVDGSQLMIANSMSIRDLDRYVCPRTGVRVHSSRGASGIDGQIATASGIAAADIGPVVLIIGDIAALHDVGSILAAARLGLDLTVIVVNDDGGGIFSMLPIAGYGDAVDFDGLFHTPHGTNFSCFDGLDRVRVLQVCSTSELTSALAADPSGVLIVEVLVDHQQNLAQRRAIDAALAEASA